MIDDNRKTVVAHSYFDIICNVTKLSFIKPFFKLKSMNVMLLFVSKQINLLVIV